MLNKDEFRRISNTFPLLRQAEPQLIQDFQQAASFTRIPAGKDVFLEGERVDAIALLISGVVRVYKIGETGRQITLYRFGNGQSCILTANAILNQKTFPAIATVEREAEVVLVPADAFRRWVSKYDLWRDFVFDILSQRLSSVMELIEEVAFRRMDNRVASLLLTHQGMQSVVHLTHQEIAAELGSSREVVSRILEDLGGRGLIRIGRGEVEILDRPALKAMLPSQKP
jgi:CRP/FNR family transcriptional regulator